MISTGCRRFFFKMSIISSFFAQLLAQGAKFHLQFPDALLALVVMADLTYLHPTLQPATQGVDANTKVSGDLLGLPPRSVPSYQPGFKGLIIARRRCSFFTFDSIVLPLPFLRLTFLSVNSDMGAICLQEAPYAHGIDWLLQMIGRKSSRQL